MTVPASPHEVLFASPDLRSFTFRFLRLPEIRAYLTVMVALAVAAMLLAPGWRHLLLPPLVVALLYPAFEYVLHRWVLHVLALCRTRPTARLWWRLHYRHHSEPRDAEVIFASPPSLLVAVAAGAGLAALPFGSAGAFASAATTALAAALLYEYFHSLAHARLVPPGRYFARMRRHHMMHHHLADDRNYGIVTDIVDRLAGTVAEPRAARSPTAYNLGYTEEVARSYPWVEQIEPGGSTAPPTPPLDGERAPG